MKVLIVVPARYESSRFPGKPLIELTGADGKTKVSRNNSCDNSEVVDTNVSESKKIICYLTCYL